jgi:membrane associated rhomboid family serine protease
MADQNSDIEARLKKLMVEVDQTGSGPMAHSHQRQAPVTKKPTNRGMLAQAKGRFLLPIYILAVPWTQEIIDQVLFQGGWNWILYPRSLNGIPGIFLSAFSHANFAHLLGNSIAFLIFSWLILAKSRRDYIITFVIGWIGGGIFSWLLGPASVHGLSGVVYTLFGYLLVIGWLERRVIPLLISVFVLLNYSATLWGVLPSAPMVAWWGHLFGLALGIFAAFGLYREPTAKQ